MACRICGTERNVEYRTRSAMFLCDFCDTTTPAKVGYEEFLATIQRMEPEVEVKDDSTMRSFFSDYRTSTFGPVADYWAACSTSEAA